MSYSIERAEFESLVEAALATVPKKFLRYFKNLTVHVEDYPDDEIAESVGMRKNDLLGLFRGSGYANPGFFDIPLPLPDSIILYQKNIESICNSRERLLEEIRITLVHEVGHYFGLSDDDLAQYQY
jgi:predicted Zn-dependent protease with MMP-like domain